jgi:hypothetical protein
MLLAWYLATLVMAAVSRLPVLFLHTARLAGAAHAASRPLGDLVMLVPLQLGWFALAATALV